MAIPHVCRTHTAGAQKAVIIGNFFGLFCPNDQNDVSFPLRQSHEMALQLLPFVLSQRSGLGLLNRLSQSGHQVSL
jgi:hypothetical protein